MDDAEAILLTNKTIAEEFELEDEQMMPEAHLVDDLALDSLDIVDMIVVLQNAFGVKLRDEASIRNVKTLGDLHTFILKKRAKLAQGS